MTTALMPHALTPGEITHRAVLIAGASGPVGRAVAQSLAGTGWGVALHFSPSGTDTVDLAAAINRQGGKAVAIAANLADIPTRLVTEAVQALGALGGLVLIAVPEHADGLAAAFAAQVAPAAHAAIINVVAPKPELQAKTETAAIALAPKIRVNTISLSRAGGDSAPLRRTVSPAEIAATVGFVLATPAVTGQMIAFDASGAP